MFVKSNIHKVAVNLLNAIAIDIEATPKNAFQVRARTSEDKCCVLAEFDNEKEALAFMDAICEEYNKIMKGS